MNWPSVQDRWSRPTRGIDTAGAAALRCGPSLGSWPGSAALGGAGLAVRLAVLVALVTGLLATAGRLARIPTGLTALLAGASLPALATTAHGAAHSGGQR